MPTLIDSYNGSLDVNTQLTNTDANSKVGQSFVGDGGVLNCCRFDLKKYVSPTGNAVAKIYAEYHATAFGTDSVPTGSVLATSDTAVYLQIFNRNTSAWETVDFDNATAADNDFTLTANIANLTNYKDGSNMISCRVYQDGGAPS